MPKISDEVERAIAARIIEDPSPNLTKIGEAFGVGYRVVARIRRLPYVVRALRRKISLCELRARIARHHSRAAGKVLPDGRSSGLQLELRDSERTRYESIARRNLNGLD